MPNKLLKKEEDYFGQGHFYSICYDAIQSSDMVFRLILNVTNNPPRGWKHKTTNLQRLLVGA